MSVIPQPMRQPYYSRNGLWRLFLLSAFAPHVWTILLVLRDFGWISERTDVWDAIGVGAYGLLVALADSVLVFIIAFLLGFLITKAWGEKRRIVLLGVLIQIVACWEIFAQLFYIWELSIPTEIIGFLGGTQHPLWYVYALTLIVVLPPIFILTYLILSFNKVVQRIEQWIEPITLLVSLYLVLDIIALAIILIRNLQT